MRSGDLGAILTWDSSNRFREIHITRVWDGKMGPRTEYMAEYRVALPCQRNVGR